MNRKFPYDQMLLFIVLALVGFGLVMVFSASSVVSTALYGSPSGIFTRQLIAAVLGMVMLLCAMHLDYHAYQRPAVIWAMLVLTFLLLILALLTPATNGARRWIDLGPFNFQPSELAKLSVIFFTAYFLVQQGGMIRNLDRKSWAYLAVVGSIITLVLVEPDLGTSLSLATTAALLLVLGGMPLRYLGGILVAGLPLFYLLVYRVPYRRDRILAFLDPSADPFGAGYQIRQSLIAVGSGGWEGRGFAEGTQKLFYLPEPHTDFIFAVVGEELGLMGCLSLLFLFVLLFWRGVRISLRADTLFGTFLGLGIVSMISFQALFNMSVALSLVPTKGIPLPFISVGGSSMLIMLSAVGILMNISRHTRGRTSRSEWLQEPGRT